MEKHFPRRRLSRSLCWSHLSVVQCAVRVARWATGHNYAEQPALKIVRKGGLDFDSLVAVSGTERYPNERVPFVSGTIFCFSESDIHPDTFVFPHVIRDVLA